MREDMKHIVHNSKSVWHSKYKSIRNSKRGKFKEDSPNKESIIQGLKVPYGHEKDNYPRLEPLKRYIASQVGKQWSVVYSEICKQGLQEYVKWFVDFDLKLIGWGDHFYVDENGILCHNKQKKYRHRKNPKIPNNRFIPLYESSVFYVKYENIWYKCDMSRIPERVNYSKSYLSILYQKQPWIFGLKSERYKTYQPNFYDKLLKKQYSEKNIDLWNNDSNNIYFRSDFYCTKKKQCGQKELKFIHQQLEKL